MIALGIQRPGDVVKATVDTSFYHGFTSVTNIVFAFGECCWLACSKTHY
jgi:hypothetical protein